MNMPPWSWTVGRAASVVSPAPRDLWRAALSADPGALLSHTPEWIDMICAVDGWTDASRLYVGHRGATSSCRWSRSVYVLQYHRGVSPTGMGFGGLVGAEVTPDEVATVCADLARQRLLRLRVCPNSLQGGAWTDGIANNLRGAVTIPRRAHAIDLDGGTDAVVWKPFSDNARRGIRKAEKQSLDVECDTNGSVARRIQRPMAAVHAALG